jgi:hypothetical protein
MTNLLPPRAKKIVRLEYWLRMGAAWCVLWAVACVVAGLLVVPTYVLLSGGVAAYELTIIDAAADTEEFSVASQSLRQSTQQSADLVSISQSQHVYAVFTEIEQAVPAGIMVESYAYTTPEDNPTVRLSGVAANRDALILLRDQLAALDMVSGPVTLPIENLAQKFEIPFTLTLNLSPASL